MNPTFKVWQVTINEDDLETGVEYVALVDDPAILRTWQAFNSHHQRYRVDAGRRIVQGPMMIPNLPIYRNDPTHGEHFVTYTKESIEKICQKFFRQKNTGNVNLMHLPAATTNGAFMFESFLTDESRGIKAPEGFTNLPDGTWFGSYLITDEAIWKEVQAGTFSGFSVEGFFNYENSKDVDSKYIENLITAIRNGTPYKNEYLPTKAANMSSQKVSAALAALKALFMEGESEAVLKDGTQVAADGGFVQGATLNVVTQDGRIPAPKGTYELSDGTILEVMGGVIMNVTAPEANQEGEFPKQEKEKSDAMTEEFKQLKASFDAFKNESSKTIEAIATSLKDVVAKFDTTLDESNALKAEFTKVQEAQKQVVGILKQLESTPANDPVQKQIEKQPEGAPRFIVDKFRGTYAKIQQASQFKIKN